jgi:ribonuclease R
VRGFGFVDLDVPVTTPGGTTVTSCFVPPPMTKGLLADDRLEVGYQVEEDGRATATSATLRERVRTEVYGVVEEGLRLRLDPHLGSGAWTLEGRVEDLPVGVAVLADITGPTTADPSDEWEDPTSADALLERVRIRHRLPLEHPAEALAEVAAVAGAGGKPRRGGLVRRDLRELTTLTIDSPSSRDLDDALSVYPADAEGGIRVCVHISDVAAHVRPGTALDAEARRAATSVYLPGWTRPMLPPQLSEDALSLVPDADRDALTVEMRIAPDGTVTAADVYATRIRSNTRLSYETACRGAGRPAARRGRRRRARRAALAAHGGRPARRPAAAARRRRGPPGRARADRRGGRGRGRHRRSAAVEPGQPAHRAADGRRQRVGGRLAGRPRPARHLPGAPLTGRAAAPALEAFCAASGYHPGFGSALTPLDLAALSPSWTPPRTTPRARCGTCCSASSDARRTRPSRAGTSAWPRPGYSHFTSPIRRYADLAVHRVLHAYLGGSRDAADFPTSAEMEQLCGHINTAARTASQAENQMRKSLWLAELASADPATTYPARVTGVGPKGVFVTLDRSRVSGMLATRSCPAGAGRRPPTGWRWPTPPVTGSGYGDLLTVRITKADWESGQLELALDGPKPTRERGRARTGARAPRTRAATARS